MIRKKFLPLCLLPALVMTALSACSSAQATPASDSISLDSPLSSPLAKPVTTPAQDVAAVTGVILSQENGQPLSGISVHLAQVFRQGNEAAYILNTATSPSTVTDRAGQFAISNIPPREYVIVIGDPSARYAILTEPDGRAKVWSTQPGKILDIGIHRVTLQ